jgi:hypothetical protein
MTKEEIIEEINAEIRCIYDNTCFWCGKERGFQQPCLDEICIYEPSEIMKAKLKKINELLEQL